MLADETLRPRDALFQGRDAQFVVLDPQHDYISTIDTQGPAKNSGNQDPPAFIDAYSGFALHNIFFIISPTLFAAYADLELPDPKCAHDSPFLSTALSGIIDRAPHLHKIPNTI